jgi:hypothetical protein
VHASYGHLVVEYYRTLFGQSHDTRALDYSNLYLYGALFDGLSAWIVRLSPFGLFETRHLVNAAFGYVGILGCWQIARILAGPRAAFWAALLLTLTPRYYGHMFNNPVDLPFAVGYAWSLYFILCAIPFLPRLPRGMILKLGLALGLTLGIRVGGFVLGAYLALVMGIHLLSACFGTRREPRPVRVAWQLGGSFFAVAALAYATMLVFWPWAQRVPLLRPFLALHEFTQFGWWGTVLFDGEFIRSTELPRSYITHYLLITSPELVLLLLAVGLLVGMGWLARRGKAVDSISLQRYVVVIVGSVFPVAYVAASGSVLYDGLRHLLFVVPPLTALAGVAYHVATTRIARRSKPAALTLQGLVAAYLAFHVYTMVALHPHQYLYFNRLVGGLGGAYGRYETDYWGNSYREAVLRLRDHLTQADGPAPHPIYRIAVCSNSLSSTYYFPENFLLASAPEQADFLVATTRWNCHESLDGDVLLRVERFGVPLAIVKDRRRLEGSSRSPDPGA